MQASFLPKVRFEIIDINRETDLFYSFTKDEGRWSYLFDKIYPELRAIREKSKDKIECWNGYKAFLEKIHTDKASEILAARDEIQLEWDLIGSDFLTILSEHFETSWPEDKPDIFGYVSAMPVWPRFLDTYSFCVGYKKNLSKPINRIETPAHEILHFLWFKKWKEVFPEIERKEYESPHLAWRLSEVMDPIILQCHPKIKNLIKPLGWGYPSFKDVKIGGVDMAGHFKKIYEDSLTMGDTFEAILKKLWTEAKKHETEIGKF